jgi:hypothetical protein
MPAPIIFLDIDGVIHGSSAIEEAKITNGANGGWKENVQGNFNKGGRLLRVIEETGAVIVLSSAWRREQQNMDILAEGFEDETEGWGIKIWDTCPATPRFPRSKHRRETEIRAWFKDNGISEKDRAWIAIDDEDLYQLPKANFVLTDPAKGQQLTEAKADECIKKLKAQM